MNREEIAKEAKEKALRAEVAAWVERVLTGSNAPQAVTFQLRTDPQKAQTELWVGEMKSSVNPDYEGEYFEPKIKLPLLNSSKLTNAILAELDGAVKK